MNVQCEPVHTESLKSGVRRVSGYGLVDFIRVSWFTLNHSSLGFGEFRVRDSH